MRKTVARVLAALVTGLLVGCGSVLAQAQTNLIKNPSFETIDDKRLPADWHLRGIALEGKSGQPRLRIGPPACDGQNAARLSLSTRPDGLRVAALAGSTSASVPASTPGCATI